LLWDNDVSSILLGVPQGSDLSPDLYNIFTAHYPQSIHTLLATYADDTANFAINANSNLFTNLLQNQVNKIVFWAKQWRIKINTKNQLVAFTLKRDLPRVPVTKYELHPNPCQN